MLKKVFSPASALRPYIRHYLQLEINSGNNTIGNCFSFPDGCCSMHIYYSSDLPVFIFPDKKSICLRNFVSGYLLKGVKLANAGIFKCAVVEFTPVGSYHLFGIPPSAYSNTFVNTKDLPDKFPSIFEKFSVLSNESEFVNHLNSFFIRKLSQSAIYVTTTEYMVNYIIRNNGNIRIDQLQKEYNISLRSIDRHFNSVLGITPKEYAWLTKLNRSYSMLLHVPKFSIQDVVYLLGYYDQSHMIRSFLKYSDITPADLFANTEKACFPSLFMSGLSEKFSVSR